MDALMQPHFITRPCIWRAALAGHPVDVQNIRVLQDTTFEMEKQRNRPVKYDRQLAQKTIKAMEKITEVSSTARSLAWHSCK